MNRILGGSPQDLRSAKIAADRAIFPPDRPGGRVPGDSSWTLLISALVAGAVIVVGDAEGVARGAGHARGDRRPAECLHLGGRRRRSRDASRPNRVRRRARAGGVRRHDHQPLRVDVRTERHGGPGNPPRVRGVQRRLRAAASPHDRPHLGRRNPRAIGRGRRRGWATTSGFSESYDFATFTTVDPDLDDHRRGGQDPVSGASAFSGRGPL